MKVHYWAQLIVVSVLGSFIGIGCTAESGGELAILRVPVPSETCEIRADDEETLGTAIFDPAFAPETDNAVRLGLVVKNSLRTGESGNEVNDSGESVRPVAANNVTISGFNVCYYVENDPRYQALAADGIDAIREDCEGAGSTIAVKEFSSGSGSVPAETDAQPETGSVVFATLLRSSILDALFGNDFDIPTLHNIGFANSAQSQFNNCLGPDMGLDGSYNSSCNDPSLRWATGSYTPWVTAENNAPSSGNTAWGTFPFRCIGDDCILLPQENDERVLQNDNNVTNYLVATYGDFTRDLPNARTTVVAYLQAVGETVTGSEVTSSFFLVPIDLCIGCIRDRSFDNCSNPLSRAVCTYGSCTVGDPTAGGPVQVEECTAPGPDGFTGCASAPTNECYGQSFAITGEEPQVFSCGGGYHIDSLLGFACLTRACAN